MKIIIKSDAGSIEDVNVTKDCDLAIEYAGDDCWVFEINENRIVVTGLTKAMNFLRKEG